MRELQAQLATAFTDDGKALLVRNSFQKIMVCSLFGVVVLCKYDFKMNLRDAQVAATLPQACYLAAIKPISGCVRIACL